MDSVMNNAEEILDRQVCGFHRYIFSSPVRLDYVSQNLCELTGMTKKALLDGEKDLYLKLVHPADREKYSDFIHRAAQKEQTVTCEYRIVKKNGTVISVRDTVTTCRDENGNLTGYSVLADITEIRNENRDLKFLNETIPCGFLRYTCEKQPRITYINPKMIEFLRFPEAKEGEIDYLEMYKSNIFLMIPMEERRRFSKYLGRVYSSETPIAGDMSLLRCDGTRAHIFGWVTKSVNET